VTVKKSVQRSRVRVHARREQRDRVKSESGDYRVGKRESSSELVPSRPTEYESTP